MKKSPQFQDYIANMYNTTSLSKTVTFQVTDACNLACKYCYQINKGHRVMPFNIAKVFIDKLLSDDKSISSYISTKTSPAIVLEFIGGEPFLEVDLIDEIITYFRKRAVELRHPWAVRFCVSICSNGVLYRDPKVQKFLQKYRDVLSFSITVDGTKELHDKCRVFPNGEPSYYLAHDAAIDWMHRGYEVGSKITISPDNVPYVAECMKQMVNDGYTDINCNTVFEEGWSLQNATDLYYQFKNFITDFLQHNNPNDYIFSYLNDDVGKPLSTDNDQNWCGGTGSMLGIDPDGYIYPCIRYMESSIGNSQEPYRIGNVWDGIGTNMVECDRINCLNCITRKSQSTKDCIYCPIASQCAWCSAYNYQCTGTPNKRVTFSCDMHKSRSLSAILYHNLIALKDSNWPPMNMWIPESWAVPIIGKKEYEYLKDLTCKVGGYINEDEITLIETASQCITKEECEEAVKCNTLK